MKLKTDIPGFERGKLHCIDCSDELTKVFLAERLIAELRSKYCTSVAYFSTHDTAESIENLQSDHSGLVGTLYAENLENNDCDALYEKAAEMIDRKFVRAIIIDSIEGIDIRNFDGGIRAKRTEIKTCLNILAATKKVPVLLFCPYRKSVQYDKKGLDPFSEILPQLSDDI